MTESAFNKVTREGISRNIYEAHVGGDSHLANAQLDIYPGGRPRNPIGTVAMYQMLKVKGSPAARFFEREALAIVNQETGEIPIVTPEMLKDVA